MMLGMADLRIAHTADLDARTLRAARDLLQDVFDDLSEQDWDHALGGMHALVWERSELVGHAALVQRRLLHQGRAWRSGYVECLAVRADERGHGHGAAMMEALERLALGAYDFAALSATEEAASFYAARGWKQWAGRTWALTPSGVVRTEDEDGGVYVLPFRARLDLAGDLTCDWRDGDVW